VVHDSVILFNSWASLVSRSLLSIGLRRALSNWARFQGDAKIQWRIEEKAELRNNRVKEWPCNFTINLIHARSFCAGESLYMIADLLFIHWSHSNRRTEWNCGSSFLSCCKTDQLLLLFRNHCETKCHRFF